MKKDFLTACLTVSIENQTFALCIDARLTYVAHLTLQEKLYA